MLSKDHLSHINQTVENQGVKNSSDKDRLFSNLCAITEFELLRGESFEHAYHIACRELGLLQEKVVSTTAYPLRWRERFQENIYGTAIFSASTLIGGALLKINHMAGGNLLLGMGLISLCAIPFIALHRASKNKEE